MPRRPRIIQVLRTDNASFDKLISRRAFIDYTTRRLLAGSSIPFLARCQTTSTQATPSIAIIGAGMAGLSAAYHLQKAGFYSQIYEATNRVGGRIQSVQNVVAEGITTEVGGEFIDSNHTDILGFCDEFSLPKLDMQQDANRLLIDTDYYFNDRRITEKEIIAAFIPFASQIQKDVNTLTNARNANHSAIQILDRLSIDEYLQKKGIDGWLFDLLTTSFTSELGLASGDQSCLNLLMLFNNDTSNGFKIYGDSDERYKVAGGNERIIRELQLRLKNTVKDSYQLSRIVSNGSSYRLSFENGQEVKADFVIITLPFTVLRDVELKVDLPLRKQHCIRELGYGTQAKLVIGVQNRIWRKQGYSGYVLSDKIHNGWDSSQMQNNNVGAGGYCLFLGGDKGKNLTDSSNNYSDYLQVCNAIYPGIIAVANNRKAVWNWNKNPMTRGAYACYKVGQVSQFRGVEARPEGSLFFAGEHCSKDFQGFMNGAAETGRKAAYSIIRLLVGQKSTR